MGQSNKLSFRHLRKAQGWPGVLKPESVKISEWQGPVPVLPDIIADLSWYLKEMILSSLDEVVPPYKWFSESLPNCAPHSQECSQA